MASKRYLIEVENQQEKPFKRIGKRRDSYGKKKEAYERAKRAGNGAEPVHHPKGTHGNKKNHYHPGVPNNYSETPHQPNSHDHYYYGGIPWYKEDKVVPEGSGGMRSNSSTMTMPV